MKTHTFILSCDGPNQTALHLMYFFWTLSFNVSGIKIHLFLETFNRARNLLFPGYTIWSILFCISKSRSQHQVEDSLPQGGPLYSSLEERILRAFMEDLPEKGVDGLRFYLWNLQVKSFSKMRFPLHAHCWGFIWKICLLFPGDSICWSIYKSYLQSN